MTIAIVCAAIALLAVVIAAIQNESFRASGIRRLFLALNFIQVLTIGLTCVMIVTEAIGFPYRVRDVVPPMAALLLTTAATLCFRIAAGAASGFGRAVFGTFGTLFLIAAIAVIAVTILFIGTPLSFAAIALALALALLLAIPERQVSA
jgi:hypothetical protein